MRKTTILLIDNQTLVSELLAFRLNEENYTLVTAHSGNEALKIIKRRKIDLALIVDFKSPLSSGFGQLIRNLKKSRKSLKIMIVSTLGDHLSVYHSLKLGCQGYLSNDTSIKEMIEAISSVIDHGFYFNELSGAIALDALSEKPEIPKLTARELEFVVLCCSELLYKDIAERMGIGITTLDNYRMKILKKCNLKSRVGIVLYAVKHRIYKFD